MFARQGFVSDESDPASGTGPLPGHRRPTAVPRALGRLLGPLAALRDTRTGLPVLALVVGACAGLGALVFRRLIRTFTLLLSGHADYAAAGHTANPHVPWLGPWFVVLAPVVTGLLYGPLVWRFAPETRGGGVPEVMLAVARGGGRIAARVAIVKPLASALCIGGGGSVGRAGPVVHLGAAIGWTVGRVVDVAQDRIRVLVAGGAAAGIAGTFNAPLAAVFFTMELILRGFTAESFGMVALASVIATVIDRAVYGDTPFLRLPALTVHHPSAYLLFAALGLLGGSVAVGFIRVLGRIEDACDRAWRGARGPEWARPGVGGLLLGLLLLVLPQMYGVGYPVLRNAVTGRYVFVFLLALLAGKAVACGLTLGIGGSGGVFAPSLFIGAMLGSAFGTVAHQILPGTAGPPGAYGLAGMGAVFAGAARAPITAVVLMVELTGEYTITLPLMTAIALATGVSRALSLDTVYTFKLRQRGVDLDGASPDAPLTAATIRRIINQVCPGGPADLRATVRIEIPPTAGGTRRRLSRRRPDVPTGQKPHWALAHRRADRRGP